MKSEALENNTVMQLLPWVEPHAWAGSVAAWPTTLHGWVMRPQAWWGGIPGAGSCVLRLGNNTHLHVQSALLVLCLIPWALCFTHPHERTLHPGLHGLLHWPSRGKIKALQRHDRPPHTQLDESLNHMRVFLGGGMTKRKERHRLESLKARHRGLRN